MNLHNYFPFFVFFFSDMTEQINETLKQGDAGRFYAIVYIRGIQHKVTAGDVIVVKYDFPPNVGDRLRLEKVRPA